MAFSSSSAGISIDINWTSTDKNKMDLNLNLIPYTKINSKWMMDLITKCKIIKLRKKSKRKPLGSGARQRILRCGMTP